MRAGIGEEEVMASPILVTGGTGTLGRLVVARLRDAGCDVRVVSRRSRDGEDGIEFVTGDLATGEGIEAAVQGAEIIVHCAGTSNGDEDKARHLVRAANTITCLPSCAPRHSAELVATPSKTNRWTIG
jgi:nucleoside-diphosphate-sugar epimerase